LLHVVKYVSRLYTSLIPCICYIIKLDLLQMVSSVGHWNVNWESVPSMMLQTLIRRFGKQVSFRGQSETYKIIPPGGNAVGFI